MDILPSVVSPLPVEVTAQMCNGPKAIFQINLLSPFLNSYKFQHALYPVSRGFVAQLWIL